jgi:integrase/recombinase XerD
VGVAGKHPSAREPALKDHPQNNNRYITEPGYRKGQSPPNTGLKYPPSRFSPEEVQALLHDCGGGIRGARQRAIIALLYRTGIEIGEALGLRMDDVDLEPDRETIHVRAGRATERVLALDDFALPYLRSWLKHREQKGLVAELLFCTYQDGRSDAKPYPQQIRQNLARSGTRLGIARVHPQGFRHTLAAELLVEGWPLPYIQAQLGIKTLYALSELLRHLDIRVPEDDEVREIIRNRPPSLGAP